MDSTKQPKIWERHVHHPKNSVDIIGVQFMEPICYPFSKNKHVLNQLLPFVTQDWLPKNGENQLHSWISVQVWVTEIRNHLVEGTLFFWALWTRSSYPQKEKSQQVIHLFVVRDDFLSSWLGLQKKRILKAQQKRRFKTWEL